MPSETEIANLALQHLGESPIIALTDTGDKTSRTCAVNFAQARDEALQTAPWSCAKKQVALSRLAQAPLFKWAAAYQLPGDFIRLLEIDGLNAWLPAEYFDRHGDTLVMGRGTDADEAADTVNIEYIFRQTDTSRFDPLLVECVAMNLAMKMARTLTGSDSKGQQLREEYERIVLPRARTLNAQQIHSGKNHPVRSMLRRSLLNRARQAGDASHVGLEPW